MTVEVRIDSEVAESTGRRHRLTFDRNYLDDVITVTAEDLTGQMEATVIVDYQELCKALRMIGIFSS